jgi:hypothetical protein
MNNELIAEFSRMLPTKTLMERKQELIEETTMLNSLINDIDTKIEIYSTIDFVHVGELVAKRNECMSLLMDVLSESNGLWLQSIKHSIKVAV